MKQCPQCHRVFYDETLNFCLEDGTPLPSRSAVVDEAATAALPDGLVSGKAATRTQQPNPSAPEYLTSEPSTPAVAPHVASSRNTIIAGVFGILLVTALGVGSYFYNGRSAPRIGSIAVMPFVNQGGNPDIEYLSDGITETLISSLTQLPDPAVKPRSSVFRYKGRDLDAKTVGKELNVGAILNGTVAQRGNETALHVELIDTSNETLLWSRDYKRPLASLVALQSEVTRDVIDRLKVRLDTSDQQRLAKNYTENAEAYRLYILGRYFWNKQNGNDVDKSIEYFQRAIAIDPNYALAYAGLADAYSLNVAGADRERMAKAKVAALKAVSLDDNLAEAHASLGRPLAVDDYDFAGAEREMRRAIELNPNYGTAHHFLGDLLSVLGRNDEAFPEHQRSIELEPFSAVFLASYSRSLIRARRYDEAIAQANRALKLDPNLRPAYGALGLAYELTGRYAESVEVRAKANELAGDTQSGAMIRASFAKGGWAGVNRYLISENRPKTLPLYSLAVAYTELGEKEKAFDALNKAAENHEISVHQFLKSDSRIDPLRSDPRFQELLRRVGFVQ